MRWLGGDCCLIFDHFEKNYCEPPAYAPPLRDHSFAWVMFVHHRDPARLRAATKIETDIITTKVAKSTKEEIEM
jgi:hypothetical protein